MIVYGDEEQRQASPLKINRRTTSSRQDNLLVVMASEVLVKGVVYFGRWGSYKSPRGAKNLPGDQARNPEIDSCTHVFTLHEALPRFVPHLPRPIAPLHSAGSLHFKSRIYGPCITPVRASPIWGISRPILLGTLMRSALCPSSVYANSEGSVPLWDPIEGKQERKF